MYTGITGNVVTFVLTCLGGNLMDHVFPSNQFVLSMTSLVKYIIMYKTCFDVKVQQVHVYTAACLPVRIN